jgi:Zn-finger nucleic acid-binding protein
MRSCPHCKSVLRKAGFGSVSVDGCERCGGLWFDRGELTAAARRQDGLLKEVEARFEPEAYEPEPKTRKRCPDCGVGLFPFKLDHTPGITLDGCAKCKGVWLDDQELQVIHERLHRGAPGTRPSGPAAEPLAAVRQKARQAVTVLVRVACPNCGESNPASSLVCWSCGVPQSKQRGRLCPRCDEPLSVEEFDGISVDNCKECAGVWLEAGELRKVVEQGPTEVAFFQRLLGEVGINLDAEFETRAMLLCPGCTVVLQREVLKSAAARVDRCPTCEGIWLDAGELSTLAEHGVDSVQSR